MLLLGEKHLYSGFGVYFDPEGLLSTIPSVGTVIIGYLMGGMLTRQKIITIVLEEWQFLEY